MAESVVSFAIEKLASFIAAEAELLGSLQGEVKSLQNELGSIKVVLKDAEKKAEEDDGIKEWLRQVREIGYQIEDVIDEYLLLKQQEKQQDCKLQRDVPNNNKQSQQSSSSKMSRMIKKGWFKIVGGASNLKPKHELATTIKDLKAEIHEINRRRQSYEFIATEEPQVQHNCWQDPRVCSMFMDDSELVGVQDSKREIMKLLDLEQEDSRRSVIAVVGMGGIGKTTLVSKVYEDKEVRSCFPFYAWVTVSQSYKRLDLLSSMLKQLQSSAEVGPSDEVSIIGQLRAFLDRKRYIVVLDDVWDPELWMCIKVALPSNGNSSKILMTTRNENIAHVWVTPSAGHIYNLKPLPAEVAWDLFCHKTFVNGHCPPQLEELSRNIVAKCKGLPLGIVAIGGLLCTKGNVLSEWNRLHHSLGTELGSNPHFSSTRRILLLSYHELPYYLMPCFLYFGMFPEDYSIDGMKLVRLWIAEGYVTMTNHRGKTLEEVAEEYLTELVHRSLVLVSDKDEMSRNRRFQVHDILHEIILSKFDDLRFAQVLSKDNSSTNDYFRRLSVHDNYVDNNVSEIISNSNIRSLLIFKNPWVLPVITSSFSKLARLLKVLDLQDAPIHHIPEEVGSLKHLRHLSLRNTKVKVLPKAIGQLEYLQTLDLKHTLVSELPREINRLHRLRHLLVYPFRFCTTDKPVKKALTIPEGVLANFKELQKLACVEANRASLMNELLHLKQLRRLEITKLRREYGRALGFAVDEMKHLRSLSVCSVEVQETLDLQHINSPPLLLEHLYLEGFLEKLPDWVTKLNNLTKLQLNYSRLEGDPANLLQRLPNLVSIVLQEAYVGNTLDFGATGFQKLQGLDLYNLQNLKMIKGALPVIQRGRAEACPQLEDLPSHLELIFRQTRLRVAVLVSQAALQFISPFKHNDIENTG